MAPSDYKTRLAYQKKQTLSYREPLSPVVAHALERLNVALDYDKSRFGKVSVDERVKILNDVLLVPNTQEAHKYLEDLNKYYKRDHNDESIHDSIKRLGPHMGLTDVTESYCYAAQRKLEYWSVSAAVNNLKYGFKKPEESKFIMRIISQCCSELLGTAVKEVERIERIPSFRQAIVETFEPNPIIQSLLLTAYDSVMSDVFSPAILPGDTSAENLQTAPETPAENTIIGTQSVVSRIGRLFAGRRGECSQPPPPYSSVAGSTLSLPPDEKKEVRNSRSTIFSSRGGASASAK